jgi:drug/metabolite transporter (DMT)-like permease
MLVTGTLKGEWSLAANQPFSTRSILAFTYLTVFGSLVAFSTYIWLMRKVSAAAVATHCYVNPLVAVFLAWLLGNEGMQPNTLVAAALIVAAVILITLSRVAFRSPAPLPSKREPANWQPTHTTAVSCAGADSDC